MKTLKPANMMRQISMSVNLKAGLRPLFVLPPARQLVQLPFVLDLHPRLLFDHPLARLLFDLPPAR
jgi:hypothetical protein